MPWYAKPSGGYQITSEEGKSNVLEMGTLLYTLGYTLEAQSGVVGNVMAESVLNPWRWQGDTYGLGRGYGLFQFTPARDYIEGATYLTNYAPNLSTTTITDGALPTDGIAQITAMDTDMFVKWKRDCWRDYWDITEYSDLYQNRQRILNTWGNGTSISMEQFRKITSINDATFVFLCCYEGPANLIPNPRYRNAGDAYEILKTITPPSTRKGMPIWMMIKPF